MKAILLPFSILYRLVVQLRNYAFNAGLKKVYTSKYPVISIGNLTAGGTGKTPMIYLIALKLIDAGFKPAIISRGYGRKTKGLVPVTAQSVPDEVGDELFMLFHSLHLQVECIACEKRVIAAQWLESNSDANIYLLDDGFQHRYLHRNFDLVLTTYQKPAWNDWLIPTGYLREPYKNLKRADALVVTKMPDFTPENKILLPSNFKQKFPTLPVYACKWESQPAVFLIPITQPVKVWAFCGLGQPSSFFHETGKHYELVGTTLFKDHHNYARPDLSVLRNQAISANAQALICTEKDWIKIKPLLIDEGFEANLLPIGFLPVKHVFAPKHEQALLSRIFAAIS